MNSNAKLTIGALVLLGSGTVAGVHAQVDAVDNGTAAGERRASPAFSPKRYGVDHYSKIWGKSPFDFEIRVEEETEEEENPFEDLKLSGLVQRGEEYFVSFYDQKDPKGERIRLRTGEGENDEGFRVLRIERGENYKATKVHVEKGGILGVIEYDTKRLEAKATGAVGGGRSNASRGGGNTRGGAGGQQNNNGNANNKQQQDNAKKSAQEARNEVIQRLLEKAKQSQSRGNNNNSQSGDADQQQKRRVVLPPKD